MTRSCSSTFLRCNSLQNLDENGPQGIYLAGTPLRDARNFSSSSFKSNGLAKKHVTPFLERSLERISHDGHTRMILLCALYKLQSVHSRQVEIRQKDIVRLLLEKDRRVAPALSDRDGLSLQLKSIPQ